MLDRKSLSIFNFVVHLLATITDIGFIDFGFEKLYLTRILV